MGWLAHLADSVDHCRVFLPVYCEEYFQSDYCQWELQLALVRDPLGRRRIVVPVMLGPVAMPSYSVLIQAEDATRPDFLERLIQGTGSDRARGGFGHASSPGGALKGLQSVPATAMATTSRTGQ